MEVYCVWIDSEPEDRWVVVLRETGGERAIPMPIGVHEARAIQWGLEGVRMERPMTHDLMAECLERLSDGLIGVEITHCHEGVWYAALVVERGGETLRIDARPSDAAALALRCDAPLHASEEALHASGTRLVEQEDGFALVHEGAEGDERAEEREHFRELLADLGDLDGEESES